MVSLLLDRGRETRCRCRRTWPSYSASHASSHVPMADIVACTEEDKDQGSRTTQLPSCESTLEHNSHTTPHRGPLGGAASASCDYVRAWVLITPYSRSTECISQHCVRSMCSPSTANTLTHTCKFTCMHMYTQTDARHQCRAKQQQLEDRACMA